MGYGDSDQHEQRSDLVAAVIAREMQFAGSAGVVAPREDLARHCCHTGRRERLMLGEACSGGFPVGERRGDRPQVVDGAHAGKLATATAQGAAAGP